MLAEVFGAVFSRKFIRGYPYLLAVSLIFVAIGGVAFFLWSRAIGFVVLYGLISPAADAGLAGLLIASTVGLFAALIILAFYIRVVLIELCRQIRSGESIRFKDALQVRLRKFLSFGGASILNPAGAVGEVAATVILAAIIAAFVLGLGSPSTISPMTGTVPVATPFNPGGGPILQAPPGLPDGFPADSGLGGMPSQTFSSQSFAFLGGFILLLLLLLAPAIYLYVKLTFFRFAVVVDGDRAMASLVHSWRLANGHWWSLFGTFLLLWLLLLAVAGTGAFLLAWISAAVFGGGGIGPLLLFFPAMFFWLFLIWSIVATPVLHYGGLEAYNVLKANPTTDLKWMRKPVSAPSVHAEVFEGVFSRKLIRSLPNMGLLLLIPGVVVTGVALLVFRDLLTRSLTLSTGAQISFLSLYLPLIAGVVIIYIVASYFLVALIDFCRRLRAGEAANLRLCLTGKVRVWLRYLVASLIVRAAVLGSFLLILLGGGFTLPSFALFVPWFVIGIWAWLRIAFYPLAIVVDGETVLGSFRRSWDLTVGYWWPLFATAYFLQTALSYISLLLAAILALPLSAALGFLGPMPTTQPLLSGLAGFLNYYLSLYILNAILIWFIAIPAFAYGAVFAYDFLRARKPLTPASPTSSA